MKFVTLAVLAAAVVAASSIGGAALAHTKLISSTPTANATADKPGKIVLVFNEKLMAKFSGADLMMMAMPGMAEMKIKGFKTALDADGKTLTLLMKLALASGRYELRWFAAGADAHRMEGRFSFTVK